MASLVLLAALTAVGARYGLRTDAGRALLTRELNGLPLGPVGRLKIVGLDGDPLGAFSLQRLQIVDAEGPWLDAANVSLEWRPGELLRRRVHIMALRAESLRVLRAPQMAAQPPSKGGPAKLPVAIQLDRVQLRLETAPAISFRRGLWDVDGDLTVERNLAASGRLQAASRLHAGDGLNAKFRLADHGVLVLRADAVESAGGAMAGLLGLDPDQRLALHARTDGATQAGSLQVSTVSGARQPLSVDARWQGGMTRLQAHLDLQASRWTRFIAARAGQTADLALTSQSLGGDSVKLHAALTAQAAALSLDGPLNWRTLKTSGLGVRLQVADLSRWVSGLTLGATSTVGVLTGDVARFDYKGAIDGRRFAQSGYALDRISGPLEIARKADAFDVKTDLSGAGGGGKGPAFALLGRTPHVRLDGGRLADGRLLVRRLEAQGAGLKLSATGGQGLLGDLSFKGSAQISNLSAAAPKVRGVINADWSARQGKGQAAWTFTLDGGAVGLTLGMPQADHFIGSSPRLKASAAYGPGGLEVTSAVLTGANASMTTKGRLDARGGLGFDVGWLAKGPFDAGPLEIAGSASGAGRIGGDLAAPRADLTADIASLALGRLLVKPAHLALTLAKTGDTLGGVAAFSGASAYGPALVKGSFQLAGGAVDVRDLVADAGGIKAAGALTLRDGAPSTADLTLRAGPGAFLAHGQLSGTLKLASAPEGGLSTHIAVEGGEIVAPGLPTPLRSLSLHADGPWARLPFRISADSAGHTPWRFQGNGLLDQSDAFRQLTLSGGGRLRGVDFQIAQPAVLRLAPQARDLALHLALSGGRADVQAHQTDHGIDAELKVAGVTLAAVDPDLAGAVTGELSLKGEGAALNGTLTASLQGARSRDAPTALALAAQVRADLKGGHLRIAADAGAAQGLKSNLQLDLPVEASAAPFRIAIDRTEAIGGGFSADGELRPLWDLLVGGDQTLSGRMAAKGVFSGTLNSPHATGHAALSAGKYQNFATGLNLQDFTLAADFNPTDVRVTQAAGADGRGGKLSGSGDINLARGGASNLRLALTHFRLIDTDTLSATASGDVTVVRDTSGAAKIAGAVKVERADITPNVAAPTGVVPMEVREINRPDVADEGSSVATRPAAKPPATLDVTIRASRGVFVKGKGLNLELSLDAHVTGPLSAPDLSGRANVVLGSYDFAGKRFDFDQRGNIVLASQADAIRLDLTATRADPTLTAVVKVSGTAARPEISLSSTPVLPQDEVLSQVLFGSSAAQLSGAQAAELASALASLTGGGGFDFLGRLRQFAGLDRLALGQATTASGQTTSGTSVSGGKYVTDNVYVELTGGGRTGPSASVEWRVTRNFSIISQVGTLGDAQLSIQFRHNYR